MNSSYYVTNFYRFLSVSSTAKVKADLEAWHLSHPSCLGLIILASEGLNGTMEFPTDDLRQEFKAWLILHLEFTPHDFKDSFSHRPLFRHFKVKVRKEIVTLDTPELIPQAGDPSYLSPRSWRDLLKSGRKLNLVDTRNAYEYKIGRFKGAMDPGIEQFTELPEKLESMGVSKEEPLLLYCTGGIRCEKAVLEMRRRGYAEVFQLHGGILKYLEEFPNDLFEGECFVFDDRVAVTQELKPTEIYALCPHCSDPSATSIICKRCGGSAKVCEDCQKKEIEGSTCSRECAHHYRLKPWQKARRAFSRALAGKAKPGTRSQAD